MSPRKDADPRNAKLAKQLRDAARARDAEVQRRAAGSKAKGRFALKKAAESMFGKDGKK